ncbi:MAG: rhomboid family intramembrane serine protease [Bacteroidetes bacterium]|nr:rhomboid family intramembrane serine protease [Bacteroidota bacterium]
MIDQDKRKLRDGFLLSISFLLILWIIKLIEITFNISFSSLGLVPRDLSSWAGLFFTPLLHADLLHLFNNSVPLFVAIIGIMYFYRKSALFIMASSWLVTNILVWIFAKGGHHIGASGLVYAYISFLFFGGAFSNNRNLLGLSLVLIFAYGTMIWGIFPVENNVSWESHLIGGVVGMAYALIYRKKSIPPKKFDWEDEDDIEDMTDEDINKLIEEKRAIRYQFIPKEKS